MEKETKNTRYELAYILKVGATEAELEEVLKAAGAEVILKGPVTQIQLAYPIKKQTAGTFGFYHLTLPSSDSVATLTESLKLKDFLIRSLFVKIPKEKPAAPPRQKPVKGESADKKPAVVSNVARIDSLSNEKLEETLEEILK